MPDGRFWAFPSGFHVSNCFDVAVIKLWGEWLRVWPTTESRNPNQTRLAVEETVEVSGLSNSVPSTKNRHSFDTDPKKDASVENPEP